MHVCMCSLSVPPSFFLSFSSLSFCNSLFVSTFCVRLVSLSLSRSLSRRTLSFLPHSSFFASGPLSCSLSLSLSLSQDTHKHTLKHTHTHTRIHRARERD